MARTKEMVLPLEEKLAQALVPVEDQPYEVPENWCWCRMDRLYTINPKVSAPDEIEAAFVPMERIEAGLSSAFTFEIQSWSKARKGHTQFADGDIAFAKISPCFENRKSVIIDGLPNGIGGGTTELIVLRNRMVDRQYTYYQICADRFIQGGRQTYSGTVGQQRISMDYVRSYPIPLPPLHEQHRIVDRIERLFAELDKAKERAQAVINSYEDRKASILHRAFTGELTKEWRQNNNIPDSFWQTKPFDDVAEVKSNLVDPAGYMDYPHIAPDNIEKKTGILLDYHTVAEDGIKSEKHLFFAGQILYSKIRPYLSKVVIVDFDGLCSADMYPVQPKEGIDTRFLWYYMLSDEFLEQASTAGSRSVLPKINQKELGRIQVCVTDMTEQTEIVRILDSLLMKETAAKAAAEQAIDQIDTMKKSILARAFRGELGTNDPNDEPAIELLKRTLNAQ